LKSNTISGIEEIERTKTEEVPFTFTSDLFYRAFIHLLLKTPAAKITDFECTHQTQAGEVWRNPDEMDTE
jgi:hypothetical protein